MNSIATQVGIDVSKNTLVVYVDRSTGRKRYQVTNDEKGVNELIATLGEGSYVVSLESTGRYESLARHRLEQAGYKVLVQNPRRMRKFAEGLGYEAKTDEIDALTLAAVTPQCKATVPRSKLREELGDLTRTIEAIQKDRTANLKRLQVPGFSDQAKEALNSIIQSQDKAIKTLRREFDAKVKKSTLAKRFKDAQSVPGVGKCTARVAVAEIVEDLSGYNGRQVCCYAGLCPMDKASGETVKPSRLRQNGNKHLKGAFYMAAVNQVGRAEWAKTLYARLRKEGKTHQQAIVPIMRRLLMRVVAVFRRGSPWKADPPKRP